MLPSLSNEHSAEAMRFFMVSLAGLGVDIGIAWALIYFAGAPDPLAAVVGFSIATVTNYFGHQFWTFRTGERKAAWSRFAGFAGVVVLALLVRLVILHFLGPLLPGSGWNTPIRLGLAAAASFLVSFFMGKFLIFRRTSDVLAEK